MSLAKKKNLERINGWKKSTHRKKSSQDVPCSERNIFRNHSVNRFHYSPTAVSISTVSGGLQGKIWKDSFTPLKQPQITASRGTIKRCLWTESGLNHCSFFFPLHFVFCRFNLISKHEMQRYPGRWEAAGFSDPGRRTLILASPPRQTGLRRAVTGDSPQLCCVMPEV